MNNLGPGLGAVSAHYGGISDTAKIALGVGMVLGRLEIFTVLVLFTGMFGASNAICTTQMGPNLRITNRLAISLFSKLRQIQHWLMPFGCC